MGFGLLFLGYFIATLMSNHPYGWATQIVGFYLIFLALARLWEYKHSFKRCLWPLVLMTLCQAFLGFRYLFGETQANDIVSLFESIEIDSLVNVVFVTVLMVFHFLLFSSIREIALDVEDELIVKLARRTFCIVAVYFFFNITVAFLPRTGSAMPTLTLILVLAGILYPLFVLHLLFRCYARICAPEDKEMVQKPSRFAFINRMREKRENADDRIEEMFKKSNSKENQKK